MVRIILFILFTLMLWWYLLPIAANIINVGNVCGALICLAGMAVTAFYAKFRGLLSLINKSTAGALFIRIAAAVTVCAFIYTAAALTMITVYARKTPEKSSTVVLLGCKVNGTTPSLMLNRRISAAYRYLNEHEDAVCVLSGGQGSNEDISEAQCMYDELLERGIDANRLYLEDKSTSTYENLKFSYDIIKSNKLNKNIAVVTDGFHQLRANMIAKELGINVTGAVSAKTPYYLLATYTTREVIAVLAQLFGLSG